MILQNNPLLREIQLDESKKALSLFFHKKELMTNTYNSLKSVLQTLNSFEEGGLFCHVYNVSLEIKKEVGNDNILSLAGNLKDILSLLFCEKIIDYKNCKQLSPSVDLMEKEEKVGDDGKEKPQLNWRQRKFFTQPKTSPPTKVKKILEDFNGLSEVEGQLCLKLLNEEGRKRKERDFKKEDSAPSKRSKTTTLDKGLADQGLSDSNNLDMVEKIQGTLLDSKPPSDLSFGQK